MAQGRTRQGMCTRLVPRGEDSPLPLPQTHSPLLPLLPGQERFPGAHCLVSPALSIALGM